MASANTGMADHSEAHDHPDEPVYVRMVIILAIITILEVIVYYIEALESVLVPILVVLSVTKFLGVIGWFMHLKFDDRRLSWIFVGSLMLAISLVAAVWAMFEFNDYWVGQTFT